MALWPILEASPTQPDTFATSPEPSLALSFLTEAPNILKAREGMGANGL